jgi:hypothetical protein
MVENMVGICYVWVAVNFHFVCCRPGSKKTYHPKEREIEQFELAQAKEIEKFNELRSTPAQLIQSEKALGT